MNTVEHFYELHSKLPPILRSSFVNLFSHYLHYKNKTNKVPHHLTFYITNKCNLMCNHCFYLDKLNTTIKQLTLKEIGKIAAQCKGKIKSLHLTGGEPFLRKDLKDIIRLFAEAKVKHFSIDSNGILSDHIIRETSKMLRNLDINLSLALSYYPVIGIKDPYYNHNFHTILNHLLTLEKKDPKFFPHIRFTVTAKNISMLHQIYNSFPKERIKINLYKDFTQAHWNLSEEIKQPYHSHLDKENCLTTQQIGDILSFLKSQRLPKTFFHKTMVKQLEASKIIQKKEKRIAPCYAGTFNSVLYPDGNISLCELTKPIGNIRNYKYSLPHFFESKKATTTREKLSSCSCLLTCKVKSSVLFNKDIFQSLFS